MRNIDFLRSKLDKIEFNFYKELFLFLRNSLCLKTPFENNDIHAFRKAIQNKSNFILKHKSFFVLREYALQFNKDYNRFELSKPIFFDKNYDVAKISDEFNKFYKKLKHSFEQELSTFLQGYISARKGFINEQRALKILKNYFLNYPNAKIKKGNDEYDVLGVDFIVELENEKFYFQIKSSNKGVKKFQFNKKSERLPGIIILIVNDDQSDEEILNVIKDKLMI